MFDWLRRRLFLWYFSDETLDYIGQKLLDRVSGFIQTDEFGQYLTGLTDSLVDRQIQRMYSRFGGMQKGINYAVGEGVSQANPIMGALSGMSGGMPSIADIFKSIIVNAAMGALTPQPPGRGGSVGASPPSKIPQMSLPQ